jgi:hypothetical protein
MFDEVLAEVDEQTQSFVHQPQIGKNLFTMDWVQRRDGFHFHQDAIVDDEVRAKAFIEPHPIPYDRNRNLSFDEIAVFAQFVGEGNFLHDLENARTEPAVKPVGSIYDPCWDFIFFHAPSLCFPANGAKQKITQRRQDAKKRKNSPSPPLSAFAPLRDTSLSL